MINLIDNQTDLYQMYKYGISVDHARMIKNHNKDQLEKLLNRVRLLEKQRNKKEKVLQQRFKYQKLYVQIKKQQHLTFLKKEEEQLKKKIKQYQLKQQIKSRRIHQKMSINQSLDCLSYKNREMYQNVKSLQFEIKEKKQNNQQNLIRRIRAAKQPKQLHQNKVMDFWLTKKIPIIQYKNKKIQQNLSNSESLKRKAIELKILQSQLVKQLLNQQQSINNISNQIKNISLSKNSDLFSYNNQEDKSQLKQSFNQ